ncbi:MAG TPA: 4Fe-4S dicluster domain-containing protein, partial [Nitrososphaerales archaeon]
CVPVCPVTATFKREDGLTLIDYEVCIGCGYCIQACPYAIRYVDPVRHVADKCTFCVQRVEQGLKPACVETCVGGARIFGDINDPNSEVSRIINTEPIQVLKPDLGTKPHNFYVGLDSSIVR